MVVGLGDMVVGALEGGAVEEKGGLGIFFIFGGKKGGREVVLNAVLT